MSKKDEVLDFNKPRNYTEGVFKARRQNPGFVDFTKLSDMESTNIGVTSSFRYDSPISGFKSTQQINFVDWSKLGDYEKTDMTIGSQELACTAAGGCEI